MLAELAGTDDGNASLAERPGGDNHLGVPKQYTLPQASWSVGTGVHIPNPQPSGSLQDQLNSLNPGLPPIRTAQPASALSYDTNSYPGALQRQMAQASRPNNLPTGATAATGQYGFPQLPGQPTSRFQPPPANASSAQLQALLAQLNQARQQAPPYNNPALQHQPLAGMPPTLHSQLNRDPSRPYGQTLNSLAPSHLQNSLSTLQGGINRLGVPPTLQQNSSLPSAAHYQALLRSLPNNNTSQLDQLLRSGPPVNPNPATGLAGLPTPGLPSLATEDPLQAYLSGMSNPQRSYNQGSQHLPSALPGGPSAAANLQYQMRLNNSLSGQRTILPGSGRPLSTLGGGGGSMDLSSLQPSRSPGPHTFQGQLPALDQSAVPGSTDFKHLQQLLAASGKDVPVDLLLKLQRGLAQGGPAELPKATNASNTELQRLLAGLGQNQPPLGYSQPQLDHGQQLSGYGQQAFGQSRMPQMPRRDSKFGLGEAPAERDPIVQLREQLSTHAGGLGSGQTDSPSGEPTNKGPVETPFAQEAQHVPQGQSTFLDALGRASRQSERQEPATAADNLATALSHRSATPAALQHQASAGQSRLQSLAPAATDVNAVPAPSGWPNSREGGGPTAAASTEVQANPASPKGGAPASEAPNWNWGPFTGLGSASLGAPWSQPWGPSAPDAEQAKPGPSRLGQATAGNRAHSQVSGLNSQQLQVGGLSSFFQASDRQQKVGDTDWQAQLASLQNASRVQSAQGLAQNPSGSDLLSRPSEQQAWPGGNLASLPGHASRAPSSSLFADYERPRSVQGLDQEPMIPSWLQTTSQGSGVWGAPNQPQQPPLGNPSGEYKLSPPTSCTSCLIPIKN